MKARKNDWALLSELRTQLEQSQAADFEVSRASMLALVDQMCSRIQEQNQHAGSTLKALEDAFLSGVMPGKTLSQEEHAQRFGELENRVSGLNEAGVLWLFSRLEYLAANKIYALYALAQTVSPTRIKEQCEWLPDSLIRDADRALKADKIAGGSKGKLPPEKLGAYHQDYVNWLVQGGKEKTAFDIQMSQKYHRSPEVMGRYRRGIEAEKKRRD
ncbi:hypothetical protein ACIGHJ_13890 [Stutzerimonas kunmingensis]|uniref:hypothetical protein n=1 Tax=Stutzerimonas kunmingensis TaxID=1211807 RepID=UPI0037D546FF